MTSPISVLDAAQVAQVRQMELTVRGIVDGLYAGMHRSPHKGFSAEFAEHREYVPGDEIKRLDWKVLARTDRFYIKQYEQETNLRATLALDCSASMDYPEKGTSKFHLARVLTGSLALLLEQQQESIRCIGFDHQIRWDIPHGGGASHLQGVFIRLASTQPAQASETSRALQELARKLPRRGLVILIGDFWEELEPLTRALETLRQARHQVGLIQVLDRSEAELDFPDPATFEDLETRASLEADPKVLRRNYQRLVREHLESLRGICLRLGIHHVQAWTDQPWDQALRGLVPLFRR